MRTLAAAVLLAVSATAAGPAVARPTIRAMEKALDRRLEKDVTEHPYDLLGMTRGVYLNGVGAVFTAEVALANAPGLSPFNPKPTAEQIEAIRKKKLNRLPMLRKAMREMLVGAAWSLDTLPEDERVVLAVSLFYHPWENNSGMPAQVVVQAQRKALLKFPATKTDDAGLSQAVTLQEF